MKKTTLAAGAHRVMNLNKIIFGIFDQLKLFSTTLNIFLNDSKKIYSQKT